MIMTERAFLAMVLLLIVAISGLGFESRAQPSSSPETAAPVVPNFWDPRSMADRPPFPPDKIEFLATDDFPPFSFRDADERLTGFNVDLARALCEELGSSCSLRIKAFDALIPALEEKEGDAVIAGLAKTADLVGKFAFSDAYLRLPARFAVRKGREAAFETDSFSTMTVSVVEGSRHAAFLADFLPQLRLRAYASLVEARKALADGTVDAHFGDALSLSFWISGEASDDCCTFAGGPWLEPGYFDQGLMIAVRKQDAALLDALNYALRRLQERGIYGELYLRYFPLSFY
ncbi:transporter substrate-binding domain-containing protein [Polymorphum gilvum]|uniref:transporter substrate-binding domain-containing protein n=1 Tax=Polymorphum gilvum TaxID=991904 RepID=UPI001F5A19A9|nr:transporter substrate-binding domain-containing protein [Polymorphum gilvum]